MPITQSEYDFILSKLAFGCPPPAGYFAQTAPRRTSGNQGTVYTSGTLYLTAIHLPSGKTITNLALLSAGADTAGGTHSWLALYDLNRVLLRQSTDNTAAASIVGNILYTQALTSPVVTPYSGYYYLGVCVVAATTMPTLQQTILTNTVPINTTPFTCGPSTTGLNTGTAPSPAAAITSIMAPLYWCVS
jgi:hypothetical protein